MWQLVLSAVQALFRLVSWVIPKCDRFVHHRPIPEKPVDINGLGIHMRKAALLAAVVMAAAFSFTSNAAIAQTDQNPNTTKLMRDAMNPYEATAKPAAAPKMHKHKHMKKAKK
jgi:hypothetical protein